MTRWEALVWRLVGLGLLLWGVMGALGAAVSLNAARHMATLFGQEHAYARDLPAYENLCQWGWWAVVVALLPALAGVVLLIYARKPTR